MNPFELIAENKIREAMENGDFDNLVGQGQPIDFTEDENIPAEYRMAYRILKNSGHNESKSEILTEARKAREDIHNGTVERLMEYKEALILAKKNRAQRKS